MYKLLITGNVGNDAQQKVTANGTTVVDFSVAVTAGYGDNKRTEWVTCVMFGKKAESSLFSYLKKGQKVLVEGSPRVAVWADASAEKGAKGKLELIVQDVELLGKKEDSEQPQQHNDFRKVNAQASTAPASDNFDDDIPF